MMLEGQEPIKGVSLMVTVNEHDDVPHELVAEQFTVEVPVGNAEPDAGVQVTAGAGAPVADGGVKVAMCESHCVILTGHEPITGVSLIVTVNVHPLLPQIFVAVHVTVVVPVANVEPETGEQLTEGAGVPVAVGLVQVAT